MKSIFVIVSALIALTAPLPYQNDKDVEEGIESFIGKFMTSKNILESTGLHNFESTGLHKNMFESTGLCTLCQKMVTGFDQIMTNQKVQADLSKLLDMACKQIKDQKMAQTCNTVVDKGMPTLMTMATMFFNPNFVCQKMFKTCPATTPELKNRDPKLQQIIDNYEEDLVCATCATVFGFIQQGFFNNDFANFCIQNIQPACDGIVNAEKQQKCKDTVQKFVGFIFSALNKYVTPQFLCEGRIPDMKCNLIMNRTSSALNMEQLYNY